MSEYLLLDWEATRLSALEADLSRSRVKIHRAFTVDWPEEIDPVAEPQAAGHWLKEELARQGVAAARVLVSLPREQTVVRQLELPNAPDDELADLVRLQAETRTAVSLDKLHLDYLPLPVVEGADGRGVLMVTVSTDVSQRIRAVLTAAGLELESIGVSTVAASELVARAEGQRGFDPDEIILVVTRHGPRAEISMMRHRHLVFTHAVQLHAENSAEENHRRILAEINRSVIALSRLLDGRRIDRGWVIGTPEDAHELCRFLSQRLTCTVERLDPFDLPEITLEGEVPDNPGQLAGPLGLALSHAAPLVEAVDFLDPRKPVVKPDRTRLKAGLSAAAAVLIVGGGWGGMKYHLNGLDHQITDKAAEIARINEELEQGEPEREMADVIGEWDARNVNMLNLLQEFNRILPGTDQVYLRSYKFTAGATRSEGLATISVQGHARDQIQVRDFSQRLRDADYERVVEGTEPKAADDDYPRSFQVSSQMVPGHGEEKETPEKTDTDANQKPPNRKVADR